jgi:peptidoglycan-associated lipoprotein
MPGIRIFGAAALFALAAACSHAQTVKPTTPVATPAPAPRPVVAVAPESPAPVATPVEVPPALNPIYFDFDKAVIHTDDATALEAIGQYLLRHVDRVVTIAGHCDERGTVEYNIALGDRRAVAARDFLVRIGVDGTRIKTISYGEARPADPGHDEQAWAKNRRDELQIEQKQRAEK